MLSEGRQASERRGEILQAVDLFLRVHDEWEADVYGPPQPSERFEKAVQVCIEICERGDMPADCRGLLGAVAKMGREWILYANGKMLSDHRPTRAFWDSVREVKQERAGAAPFRPRTRENVALLLQQKVSPEQIARAIYGDRDWPNGYGPFLGVRGEVDYDALEREHQANLQGKTTLPPGWVHPDDRARAKAAEDDARTKLQALEHELSRERAAASSEDPEKLLREGQYVNVVARICNMPIDDVQALANKLGIAAQETPNLAGDIRAPQEPEIPESLGRAMDATIVPESEEAVVQTPEEQVRHWAALGLSDDEIGERVGLTPRKVKKIREGVEAAV